MESLAKARNNSPHSLSDGGTLESSAYGWPESFRSPPTLDTVDQAYGRESRTRDELGIVDGAAFGVFE
jgi:hypothetical protein